MTTLALGPEWLSPDYLIETFSLPGILLIVFAESGFFAFLPGDSLLFTAGLFVAEGDYISQPLWLVCTLIVVAAVLGDQCGYMIGKFFGPKLFSRPNSKLFKQENLDKAHEFMEKYGPKAIVLARFVPIVRTFAPIVAGAGRMKYRTFLTYNLMGGVAWGTGVTLAGYWLGQIDFIKTNVEAILILIVLVSVVPIIIEYLRERAKSRRAGGQPPAAPQQHRMTDDATTQLRRIPSDHHQPPYGNEGRQQQGYDGYDGHEGYDGYRGHDGYDAPYQGQAPQPQQQPQPYAQQYPGGYGGQQPQGTQQGGHGGHQQQYPYNNQGQGQGY